MIEDEIQRSLTALTHLAVHPLILPDPQQEGVTYQKISDLKVNTGLVDSSLVQSRFQVVLYVIDDYSRLIALDKAVLNAWEGVQHGHIGEWPVQAVTRSTLCRAPRPWRITASSIGWPAITSSPIPRWRRDCHKRYRHGGIDSPFGSDSARGRQSHSAGGRPRRIGPGSWHPAAVRRTRAPNSEPSLSAGIAIRPAVTGWNAVTLRVGPSKQHYRRALEQEYGTATQAAAPFIRPALDHHKHQVLRILAAHVRYGIENR